MSDDKKRVVFLDRDGTLNVDKQYLHRIEQVELIPGVVDGLRILEGAGYLLAIVTNQSGVARGRFPESDVQEVNAYIRNILAEQGVHVRVAVYCPHHIAGSVPKYTVECECRKPNIGLANQVVAVAGPFDYGNSWSVGDTLVDYEFGVKLGTKTALIRSAYWNTAPTPPPTLVVNSLFEAAQKIRALS